MNSPERYNVYAPLAWFYDRYWGAYYPGQVLPVLDRLALSRLPQGAPILDLCCGTGHLAQALSARGHKVTGIDGSEEMLAFARRRAPGCEFLAADARDFHLPYPFQAVFSTFESLNHILSLEELEAVFIHTCAALLPGGIFLFDLLTEKAYRTVWQKSSAIVEEDNVCIVRGGYDAEKNTARTDITLFRLRGVWERSDVAISQKCHALNDVRSLLEKTSFRNIALFDAQGDLGVAGDLGVGRVFFRAGK